MPTIERVTVLHGHTSPETAYVVDDYPYGRGLRCKIRYWIETAEKGAKKNQRRLMSQTTDPRRDYEVWNKPHGSTYAPVLVMYINGDGHVKTAGVGEYGLGPAEHARLVLMGIVDQMGAADRRGYEFFLAVSQKVQRESWEKWDALMIELGEAYQESGRIPKADGFTLGDVYMHDGYYETAVSWVMKHHS